MHMRPQAGDGDGAGLGLASPGVDVSDTAADFVADGIITISGERKLEREDKGENAIRIESVYGAFARSFVLPDYADANGNHAETKDGLLRIHVPKTKTKKSEPVAIEVH
jgi:HSP20 family protein